MSDLISRQVAINALERKKDKNANGDIGGFYNKIIQNNIDVLIQLPSAEQEPSQMAIDIATILQNIKDMRMILKTNGRCINPETAHWVLLDECANSGYYCSRCRKKVVKEGWSDTVKKIKFCPNCGAKMQGVKKNNV